MAGKAVNYMIRTIRRESDPSRVALLLSLSGTIHLSTLPSTIDESFSVYEITLVGITPNPTDLRLRQNLMNFQRMYQQMLGMILKDHPNLEEISLFPAVPAPVAVLCGRELLPKVHPSLLVDDFNRQKRGFTPTLRINEPHE
jgi:SMODS-associated and fused to various effectors sensor domain